MQTEQNLYIVQNLILIMNYKKCVNCQKELPATIEFFHKKSDGKYGLTTKCKECRAIQMREYYVKNREHILKGAREYKKINKEKIREKYYLYYKRNKDFILFKKRIHQWVRNNKPKQDYCSICNQKKRLELANISGKYYKKVSDYLWLCRECHYLYDRTNNTHKDITDNPF